MTPQDEQFEITPQALKDHGITPDEYARIQKWLGRVPTKTELGIFSVMWSEHCSYKSSRVHLKRLPTESELVVQGPGENAGIIDIGDGWTCAFKIESHNHPSFIEPFQGATTGVGGILRDIFTMGARPVAVMDSLRFGRLSTTSKNEADKDIVRRNHAVFEGVVGGVASYGNCFGVPNVGGETKFEDCYAGNPLVNAYAMGLVKKDKIFYAKASGVGNPVIYVGSKTGRDGIHGATMASEEFAEGSEAKRPNVQVGDPFMEKLLMEACLEAMETGAIVAIQDMGAAGLTCSTCELGGHGGVGLEIELDLVPQRETGMTPYEIMLSESQERMLLVAEKGREEEIYKVFRKWGLDSVVIGEVKPVNRMVVKQHGVVVADIPNDALTEDAPLYHRPIGEWKAPVAETASAASQLEGRDWSGDLMSLIGGININSKRWVYQQYDSMVQTNTSQGPGYEAGLIRIKETRRALGMALDGNGRWSYLDPKLGAALAVAESARNVACTGARPVAATNCLNYGNPEKPHIMRQLSDGVDGISEACLALNTPITGGNVSLYNETFGEAIYPTPVIGVVGILDEIDHRVGNQFAAAGDALVIVRSGLQRTREQALAELGSSEFASELLHDLWGKAPALDLAKERSLQDFLVAVAKAQILTAAKDVAEGGLAVTLSEMGFPQKLGCEVNLEAKGLPVADLLFGEEATRVVLALPASKLDKLSALVAKFGLEMTRIGEVKGSAVSIAIDGEKALCADLLALNQRFESSLEDELHAEI